MSRRAKIAIATVAAIVVAAIQTAALATRAGEAGEVDVPISGAALERASDAAIAHLGEGVVTATEVGDEESYYEVEVTLADGTQVDVQLDESFHVVGTEADDDSPEG